MKRKRKRKPILNRVPVVAGWRWWRGVLMRACLGMAMLGCVTVLVVFLLYRHLAEGYDLAELVKMPEQTVVLDRKGEAIGRLYGEDRIVVPLSEVSPWFIKALLAREDSRFYRHKGIDHVGVLRAMLRNLREGRIVQGASTLTMQLARNTYPDLDDRNFHRKLVEMMLARRIERAVSKDQILEHYVNRIFFGPGLWGIQRASQVYFGKHASQLSLSESALVAGIIRGPSRYSPFRNFDRAVKERNDVLTRLVKLRAISPEQEIAARYEEVILRAQPVFPSQGGYALDAVRRELDMILEAKDLRDGGLQVVTTFDKALVEAAEMALDKRLTALEQTPGYAHRKKADYDATWNHITATVETAYLQGSLTMMDNETGGVLAIVGGRDYPQSRFNRASQGARQIGSTVKPFVYAAGIQAGLLPGSLIHDAPLQLGEITGAQSHWNPLNADRQSLGWQPLNVGLVQSRNTMTVRVGEVAGLDSVLKVLADVGLGERVEPTPQVFIGNLVGNSSQVASAYSVLANGGVRKRPYVVERITDKKGYLLYVAQHHDAAAISAGVAHLVSEILQQSMQSAHDEAGQSSSGAGVWAGKTGTTNDYIDAWFAGFSKQVTAAVWVGLDRPATITQDGYGGRIALPIWMEVMKKAEALGYLSKAGPPQIPLARVSLCRHGHALATTGCETEGQAYETALPYELVPSAFCHLHGGAEGERPDLPERLTFWQRIQRMWE